MAIFSKMTAKKTHSEIVQLYARRVREEREKKPNLSQEALADAAKVHRTYVGGLERGEINPTLTNADKVAQALGLKLADLLVEKASP